VEAKMAQKQKGKDGKKGKAGSKGKGSGKKPKPE
jgi:hypothetical protein